MDHSRMWNFATLREIEHLGVSSGRRSAVAEVAQLLLGSAVGVGFETYEDWLLD